MPLRRRGARVLVVALLPPAVPSACSGGGRGAADTADDGLAGLAALAALVLLRGAAVRSPAPR